MRVSNTILELLWGYERFTVPQISEILRYTQIEN